MINLLTRAFPPPTNWQDFERLCFDLYSKLWRTNDAELNGRVGQPQAGVDVYGMDRVEQRFAGVQCKGKDQGYGNPLTERELRDEVEKAKFFRPPLEIFTIATTAPNDAELQKFAREISNDHKKSGLFEVRVSGWTTLRQHVTNYPELIQKYFSDLAPFDLLSRMDTHAAAAAGDAEQTRAVVKSSEAALLAAIERIDPGDKLQPRIAELAKLIENGSPVAGIRALESLWESEAPKASARNRYRIRANIAFGHLVSGNRRGAIEEMRRAYNEDPEWPNARATLGRAELLEGNENEAFSLAKAALESDPSSYHAATVLIESAPPDLTAADIKALVPAPLHDRLDVLLTLSQAARDRGDTATNSDLVARASELYPDDWRVQTANAEILLTPIFELPGLAISYAVPSVLVEQLNRAISLLQGAWAQIRKRENGRIGAAVGANLLSALEIAGRQSEYERTLDEALQVAPNFPPFARKYAERMALSGDWAAAGKALAQIPSDERQDPDRIAAAEVLIRTGKLKEAISAARELESRLGGTRLGELAAAIQVEAAIKSAEPEALVTILERWPRSVVLRSIAHNLLPEADNRREKLLQEIRGLSASIDEPGDRLHAAEALYAAKQFSAAADMYSGLYAPDKDTPTLGHALLALVSSDRRREARTLFESLADDLKKSPRYAYIGVSIYEYSGLLREARALLEATFTQQDNLHRRLHWLGLCERLADTQAPRDWLKSVALDISGTPQDLMTLALALDRLLEDPKAFLIAYRALRDGYSDPQIHLGYMIGLVFSGKSQSRAFKTPDVVTSDTAVLLHQKDGDRRNY